jgi:hypothetical protein
VLVRQAQSSRAFYSEEERAEHEDHDNVVDEDRGVGALTGAQTPQDGTDIPLIPSLADRF